MSAFAAFDSLQILLVNSNRFSFFSFGNTTYILLAESHFFFVQPRRLAIFWPVQAPFLAASPRLSKEIAAPGSTHHFPGVFRTPTPSARRHGHGIHGHAAALRSHARVPAPGGPLECEAGATGAVAAGDWMPRRCGEMQKRWCFYWLIYH